MTPATRLLRLVGSWIGVGLGIPLLIRAELGVAPFDVLNTGVSDATGWSLGVCFVVDAAFFYGIGRLLGARLGWASLVGTIACCCGMRRRNRLTSGPITMVPTKDAHPSRAPSRRPMP